MASIATVSNISALSAGTSLLSSLTGLLFASPQKTIGYQPQNAPSSTGLLSLLAPPPSLVFHYEGEQTLSLKSDITDHFIEDNTAIQDQVALRPIVVKTQGFIGELNNVPPLALALLQQAANALVSVSSYLPGISTTALIAYNTAFADYQFVSNAVTAGVAAVSSIFGGGGESVINGLSPGSITTVSNQNNQQTYFQQFYGYWVKRNLFTIQTPWAVFQNMAIEEVTPVQSADDRMITEFHVTFKQINIASTSTSTQGFGRNAFQSALNVGAGVGSLNSAGPSVSQGLTTMGSK